MTKARPWQRWAFRDKRQQTPPLWPTPRAACNVHLYRGWLAGMVGAGTLNLAELRGKSLACWCRPDQECHADVLLELARVEVAS